VIEGEGRNNSLKFSSLKIYSRGEASVIEFNKEFNFMVGNTNLLTINSSGIETDGVRSRNMGADSGYRIYED
jgi:hypothetical protein